MPVKSNWVNGETVNASDLNDIATAVNAAGEPPITAGTTGQYWRGDKSWQTLDVAAVAGAAAALTATTVKTSAYTAAVGDLIPADATSAGFTVTLPTAPADKTRVVVKKIDSSTNVVTIAAGGSDVFNKTAGSTTLTLSLQYQAVQLQYQASSGIWYVVSTDVPLAGLDTRYAPLSKVVYLANYGIDATGNSASASANDTAIAAAFAAARAQSGVDGRVVPVVFPPGHIWTSAPMQMYDLMNIQGAGRGFRNNEGTTIENHATDLFSWPSGANQVRMPVIKNFIFYGQSNLAGTGLYTTYPFDRNAYATKNLWYPQIVDCAFQYFVTLKVQLLGGVIDGGQLIHFKSTALQVSGYDFSIAPSSPLYMGIDSVGGADSTVPMMIVESPNYPSGRASNIRVADIFPTITHGGQGLLCRNVDGLWIDGARIDGYNTAASTQYGMAGAGIYLKSCNDVDINAARIHGVMGGTAHDASTAPTDFAAISLETCAHVSIRGTKYIYQPTGTGTIGCAGVCSDITISGSTYDTADGRGVVNHSTTSAPTITSTPSPLGTTTGIRWDEIGTPGPTGPAAWVPVVNWSSATAYTPGPPASTVVRAGSTYAAVSASTNVDPATDDGSHWIKVAAAGSTAARQAARDQARGFGGQAFESALVVGSQAYTSQQVYATLAGLLVGDVVTNVIALVPTAAAGTAPTGVYVGLFSTSGLSGTLLAASSNLASSSIWNATGFVVAPLSAPYTITSTGGYYLAILINGAWGTTQLTLGRATSGQQGSTAVVPGGYPSSSARMLGKTTLASGAFSTDNTNVWLGWS